ncbi:MAG: hypothetical protein CVV24_09660 [Ignavibacteriae bacterium HGW-Ignavibacteriae-3]|nr:MAG: hypothetical protein CVV24_09660 [Ignavibacteriae bacterium HGW-Ignavibacteriae-3]
MNLDGIISLLIACIELVYIINLLVFSERNAVNKLVIGILVLLFGYQFIEFLICFAGMQRQIIIYLAFLDITLLPPLCLYAVLRFSARENHLSKLVFIPALFFIVYYPFVLDQFAVTKCTVLYASYHYPLGELYGIFYYLPIIFSIIILNKKWGAETDPLNKSLTRTFLFGFLFTFIPSMILAIAIPTFLTAVESLLCKLAFIFASFLFYFALKNRQTSERK